MKAIFKDHSGKRFGRLVAISPAAPVIGKSRNYRWNCVCECGQKRVVFTKCLVSGETKSCGCLSRDLPGSRTRHGRTHSLTHRSWVSMIGRCADPKRKNYGAKGISVCDRWKTFENFLADMGERPSIGYTLDRFPNKNGDYEPGNVRWATPSQQSRNTSQNRLITANGRTLLLIQWSEETGIKPDTIAARIGYGWTPEEAVSKPVNQNISKHHIKKI